MVTLSVRRLWVMYKKLLADEGLGKRDLLLAQMSFYAGARGVLKVLDAILERGDMAELERTIQGQGRQIRAIQGRRRKKPN